MAELNVLCSCGAAGVITLCGGRYVALTPGWKFDGGSPDDPPGADSARLWHCGRAGHYQAAVGGPAKSGVKP